jgi:hypothetical protein
MPDSSNGQNNCDSLVQFTSDADFLLVREEDTRPGSKISEKYRQRLREKYGQKTSPPRKSPDEANNA